ncbi:MAG: DUF1573 domain-containing protein [Tidjanibacter sp.]|nr:DUF1573 domain-containing protein [Tidjanibacter sp.]
MRRVSILLVALLAVCALRAQEPEGDKQLHEEQPALRFESTLWDFGRIEEVDGVVSHTFRYRNESDHFVAIERVYSSCGCTTGDYSRKPLKPNGEGEFTVNFDPEGIRTRGGKVEKSVTIVFDKGRGRVELEVKGKVVPRPRSVADDYPYDLGGGVRCDANYRAFGNLPQGESRSMTLALYNGTAEPLCPSVAWEVRSGLLELHLPEEVAPGGNALVTMTYKPDGDDYGVVRDTFHFEWEGGAARQSITTTFVGVDNFEGVGDERPRAVIEPIYHDFGVRSKGELCEVDVTITNNGSAPLEVRSVTPREGTTIELRAGDVVAPGESRVAKVRFEVSPLGYDTVYGGVMIVVNDPRKPVRELRVAAETKN